MQLLTDLRAEHDLIEQVIGSLRTFALARVRGAGQAADGHAFLRFFRLYAGRYHHAREEDSLFPALIEFTEAPADRGPIPVLRSQHASIAAILDAAEPLLVAARLDDRDGRRLRELCARHGAALLHHIDAENSVLFPESEARFRRACVTALPSRAADAEEAAACADGERLVAMYAPSPLPDVLRGDGCASCPSFGGDCQGVEQEWWNDLEWEDVFERIG
ncbi:MAG: hemerythrin domain-containing protein [Candidatus Binatia bacterium]